MGKNAAQKKMETLHNKEQAKPDPEILARQQLQKAVQERVQRCIREIQQVLNKYRCRQMGRTIILGQTVRTDIIIIPNEQAGGNGNDSQV